jgi:hypothetical protein
VCNAQFDDEGKEWRWPLHSSTTDKHPETSHDSAADGGSQLGVFNGIILLPGNKARKLGVDSSSDIIDATNER